MGYLPLSGVRQILFGTAPLGFEVVIADVVTTAPVVCAMVEIVVAPTGEGGWLVGSVDAVGAVDDDVPKDVGGTKVAFVVTPAPTGEVGLPVGKVDAAGAVVEDEPKDVGGTEVALVVGLPPALVIPAVVVAIVVPAVGPDGGAVVEGPEVVADVTNEVGGPDDAVVG